MDNLSLQADEIEALCSIYGNDWKTENENDRTYSMKITEGAFETILYIKLSLEYPRESPPDLQISAPNLSRMQKQDIALILDDIYLENIGEAVLYQSIEKIREYLHRLQPTNEMEKQRKKKGEKRNKNVDKKQTEEKESKEKEFIIHHGDVIQDRKSIFQGHVAEIHSLEDVTAVMENLMTNKKIADATHNISAYRIQSTKSNNISEDFNDDGESQAGRRLLHLLQITDVMNVIVIVSRWYGGIQLGPDRFRHINNAARQILEQNGYITASSKKK